MECGSLTGSILSPDFSVVCDDNRVTDREPQTQPALFCGEEWIEYALEVIRLDAAPTIQNRNSNSGVARVKGGGDMHLAVLLSIPDAKRSALRTFCDRLAPGLWEHARQPNETEWKATRVLRMRLDEVSAKVRTGPPVDDDGDYALDCWAGVVPMHTELGVPQSDPVLRDGIEVPEFVKRFRL